MNERPRKKEVKEKSGNATKRQRLPPNKPTSKSEEGQEDKPEAGTNRRRDKRIYLRRGPIGGGTGGYSSLRGRLASLLANRSSWSKDDSVIQDQRRRYSPSSMDTNVRPSLRSIRGTLGKRE
eukprot:607593-Prorocentrum_minimum.AAC.1